MLVLVRGLPGAEGLVSLLRSDYRRNVWAFVCPESAKHENALCAFLKRVLTEDQNHLFDRASGRWRIISAGLHEPGSWPYREGASSFDIDYARAKCGAAAHTFGIGNVHLPETTEADLDALRRTGALDDLEVTGDARPLPEVFASLAALIDDDSDGTAGTFESDRGVEPVRYYVDGELFQDLPVCPLGWPARQVYPLPGA